MVKLYVLFLLNGAELKLEFRVHQNDTAHSKNQL